MSKRKRACRTKKRSKNEKEKEGGGEYAFLLGVAERRSKLVGFSPISLLWLTGTAGYLTADARLVSFAINPAISHRARQYTFTRFFSPNIYAMIDAICSLVSDLSPTNSLQISVYNGKERTRVSDSNLVRDRCVEKFRSKTFGRTFISRHEIPVVNRRLIALFENHAWSGNNGMDDLLRVTLWIRNQNYGLLNGLF